MTDVEDTLNKSSDPAVQQMIAKEGAKVRH